MSHNVKYIKNGKVFFFGGTPQHFIILEILLAVDYN